MIEPLRPHGPPYRIEAVAAFDSNTYPGEVLGYQLCVLDALSHIIHIMCDREIYDTPDHAVKAITKRPMIFKEDGFERGSPTPAFISWCDYYFVPLPTSVPEPKREEDDEKDWRNNITRDS